MQGQAAVEFILVMIFMLAVLVAAMGVAFQKSAETANEKAKVESQSTLYAAANAINTAHAEGDGFSSSLTLPEAVGGYNYTIRASSTVIWLEAGGSFYAETLLTDNVTGSFAAGSNYVANRGGGIYVNS